jgi:DUF2892 family protein
VESKSRSTEPGVLGTSVRIERKEKEVGTTMFRHNVGGVDRVLRLTLGGILFLSGLLLLTGTTRMGATLVVVGLLVLLTGLVRFCALYIPFGVSTAPPGRPSLNQVCDCAVWMKTMQNNRTAVDPPAPPKEESAEATSAARGR